jgi:hypothetical protein
MPIHDPRTYMFDVLESSFPGAERILAADAAGSAGDEDCFAVQTRHRSTPELTAKTPRPPRDQKTILTAKTQRKKENYLNNKRT